MPTAAEPAAPASHDLDAGRELRRALSLAGFERLAEGAPGAAATSHPDPCPVLAWADSGAMALTGFPGRPPRWPAGAVVARLAAALSIVEGSAGPECPAPGAHPDGPPRLRLDPAAVLTGRAAARGLGRQGTVAAGGHCRLLPAADGWIALSLARPSDVMSVPALVEGTPGRAEPWARVAAYTAGRTTKEVVDRARLLALPAAELPLPPGGDGHGGAGGPGCPAPDSPWRVERIGEPSPAVRRHPRVVDLSALWAGPLCAWLLGRRGGEVCTVEDPRRRDPARWVDGWLFDQLHAGHRLVRLDLRGEEGGHALRALIDSADVVVEGSRPRALSSLGIEPGTFLAERPGRTWVSITGHGRQGAGAGRVAFGDDAAVAGGLVAADDGIPVFCADAVADPLTGVYAAVGALASWADGGGHLVDCAMAGAAAFANRPVHCRGTHEVVRSEGRWVASHDGRRRPVAAPVARPLAAA